MHSQRIEGDAGNQNFTSNNLKGIAFLMEIFDPEIDHPTQKFRSD